MPEYNMGLFGKIICLYIIWCAGSTGSNISTKKALSLLPYPLTVSMVHLLTMNCLLYPILILFNVPPLPHLKKNFYVKRIIPLVIGRGFAAIASNISLWRIPISYAHTIKALMPLFTVIMSTIILKESHSYKTYLSLLPIVGGVLMATVTELSFDLMGMLAATLSTLCFAVQNIYTKKSMREVHMHHLRLLLTLNQLATLFIFPVWMYTDAWSIISNAHKIKDIHWLALVLPASGLCGFVQSVVAFSLLSFVSPISYSVINAAKRIFVISASLLLMKNPVTAYNVVGMVTAISGVALYNKIKSDVSTRYDKTILPLTTKETLPLKII